MAEGPVLSQDDEGRFESVPRHEVGMGLDTAAEAVLRHKGFETFMGVLIILNCVTIGVDAEGIWSWQPELHEVPLVGSGHGQR